MMENDPAITQDQFNAAMQAQLYQTILSAPPMVTTPSQPFLGFLTRALNNVWGEHMADRFPSRVREMKAISDKRRKRKMSNFEMWAAAVIDIDPDCKQWLIDGDYPRWKNKSSYFAGKPWDAGYMVAFKVVWSEKYPYMDVENLPMIVRDKQPKLADVS